MSQLYTFAGTDELSQTAEALPEVERHTIYARLEAEDEWMQLPYRNSLWIEDGRAVGDVSANDEYYSVIQYGEVMDAVAMALDSYDDTLTPNGHIMLSESGHKLSAYIAFDGVAAEPEAGDQIDLGLTVRTGHTGFHGLKYDVGAQRQVCANGMMAFVSDLHFEQTHQDPLDYGLARNAVAAIVDGADVVEDRLAQANDRTFISDDEALLVLFDHGLDVYFDDPVAVLQDSLREEVETPSDQPTLYDTYNAATRAITHRAELSTDRREAALEQAAGLLDSHGTLPEPEDLGQHALDHRVEAYTAEDEVEPYWEDEEETLHTLLQARGDAA